MYEGFDSCKSTVVEGILSIVSKVKHDGTYNHEIFATEVVAVDTWYSVPIHVVLNHFWPRDGYQNHQQHWRPAGLHNLERS